MPLEKKRPIHLAILLRNLRILQHTSPSDLFSSNHSILLTNPIINMYLHLHRLFLVTNSWWRPRPRCPGARTRGTCLTCLAGDSACCCGPRYTGGEWPLSSVQAVTTEQGRGSLGIGLLVCIGVRYSLVIRG